MIMSWIYLAILLLSLSGAAVTGTTDEVSAAVVRGAQSGIELAISMAGAVCLWSGVGKMMEKAGITDLLASAVTPLLHRVFPSTRKNIALKRDLSANICANFLGLGNAATPMGIADARKMVDPARPAWATDELCRLIVLNTASIQLIPANVAAVRSGLGCQTPFDILPAVWITSLCSASLGVAAAWLLGRTVRRD